MNPEQELVKLGKDEMNLVEFPVAVLSRESTDKILEYEDNIHINGFKIQRKWKIMGSTAYGLPLSQDNDVLVALFALGKLQGFESREINFSRYQLCQIMGISACGANYKRIIESLNRLQGVKINCEKSFWDNEERDYINQAFGIIDNYAIYNPKPGRKGRNKDDEYKPLCSVMLNERLFRSIRNGFIKDLDLEIYFNLKGAIAKQLFRYLDKRRYQGKAFCIGVENLAYNHLGFDRNTYKYLSLIKAKLDQAHEELKRVGFLKSYTYEKQKYSKTENITYVFVKPYKQTKEEPLLTPEQEQLIARLKEIGVSPLAAIDLVQNYSEETIRFHLKCLPASAENPAGYLVTSVREGWRNTKVEKEEKRQEEIKEYQEQKAREEETVRAKEEKINAYLEKLTHKQREELMEQARLESVKNSPEWMRDKITPIIIEGYFRHLAAERLGLKI